jgi:hypothetical protein
LLGQQLGYNQTVFYPIWISLDSHHPPTARKRMLQQRAPTPEMQAFRQKVMHLFGSLATWGLCRQRAKGHLAGLA